jgi:mono/diheme cytochrome c family protein
MRHCQFNDVPYLSATSTVSITYLLDKGKGILQRLGIMVQRISILGLALIALTVSAPGLARAQSAAEGQKLYMIYCSSCHGDKGRGDGVAGKALPVKPADHTDGKLMNSFSDEFLMAIISKGGAAVGKSSFMPAWGGALKDNQLQDLLAYLRSIANPAKASGK